MLRNVSLITHFLFFLSMSLVFLGILSLFIGNGGWVLAFENCIAMTFQR